ncbi:hypothetical protein SARC_02274 [Sphaeroforma arctica JP610]|uniref:Uncharacterized protein n=1 Tax=Sphaeroforma arctica JP610 TaxID=667725 RepID=A0A0L0G948_9EUKA|nr:hypothetical protein SARC_02274 [Sphaeroforma arctica JP610]KNC85552.1 hypothetical protein SARC_02274 [Sphaeroforma arctica JP610]|eukprot:XP_014159454.1 hypothetical protein SARC_02274 [Sphaeroforma arctica JP610]
MVGHVTISGSKADHMASGEKEDHINVKAKVAVETPPYHLDGNWICRCDKRVQREDDCLRTFESTIVKKSYRDDFKVCPRLLAGTHAPTVVKILDAFPELIDSVTRSCNNELEQFHANTAEEQRVNVDRVLDILEYILRNLGEAESSNSWLEVVEALCSSLFKKIAFTMPAVSESSVRHDCYSVWLTFVKRLVVPLIAPYTIDHRNNLDDKVARPVRISRFILEVCLGHMLVNYIVCSELLLNVQYYVEYSAVSSYSSEHHRRLELEVTRLLLDHDWSTWNNQSNLLKMHEALVGPFIKVWSGRDGRREGFLNVGAVSDVAAAANGMLAIFGHPEDLSSVNDIARQVQISISLGRPLEACFVAKHLWVCKIQDSLRRAGNDSDDSARTAHGDIRASMATRGVMAWYQTLELESEILSSFVLTNFPDTYFGSYLKDWACRLESCEPLGLPATNNSSEVLKSDAVLSVCIVLKAIDGVYRNLTGQTLDIPLCNHATVCRRLTKSVLNDLLHADSIGILRARKAVVVEFVLEILDTTEVASVPWFVLDTYLCDSNVQYNIPSKVRSGVLLAAIFSKYAGYRPSILKHLNAVLHDSTLSTNNYTTLSTPVPSGQHLFASVVRGLNDMDSVEPEFAVYVQFTIMITDRERQMPHLFQCLQRYFEGGLDGCIPSPDNQRVVRSKRLIEHSSGGSGGVEEPARQKLRISALNGAIEEGNDQSDRSDSATSTRRSSTLSSADTVPVLLEGGLNLTVKMDRLDTQDRASLKRKVSRYVRDWEGAMASQQYGLAMFSSALSSRIRYAYIWPATSRGRDTRFDHVLADFIVRHPEFTSFVAKPSLLRLITQEQYMFVKDEQPWELLCRSQSKHVPPRPTKASPPKDRVHGVSVSTRDEIPGESFMNNIVEAHCCLHTPNERPSASDWADLTGDQPSERPARVKRVSEAEYELTRLAAYFLNWFGESERVAHIERLVRASTGVGGMNVAMGVHGVHVDEHERVHRREKTATDTLTGQEDTLERLALYYGDTVVEDCIRRLLRSIIRYEFERKHDTFIQRTVVRKVVGLVSDMYDCEMMIDRFAGTELLLTWGTEVRLHFLEVGNLDRADLLRSLLVSQGVRGVDDAMDCSKGDAYSHTHARTYYHNNQKQQQHSFRRRDRRRNHSDNRASECIQTLLLHVMLPGDSSRVTSRQVSPALRRWLKQILLPNVLDLLPRNCSPNVYGGVFARTFVSEPEQSNGMRSSYATPDSTVHSTNAAENSKPPAHTSTYSRAACALEILLSNESLFRALSTEDTCDCCMRSAAVNPTPRYIGGPPDTRSDGDKLNTHRQVVGWNGMGYVRRDARHAGHGRNADTSSQLNKSTSGKRPPLLSQNSTPCKPRKNSLSQRITRENSLADDGQSADTSTRDREAITASELAYQLLCVSGSGGPETEAGGLSPTGSTERAKKRRSRRQCTCCISLKYLLDSIATHCDYTQKFHVFHMWIRIWENMVTQRTAPWSYLVTMVTLLKSPSPDTFSKLGQDDESCQLDTFFSKAMAGLIVEGFDIALNESDCKQSVDHFSAADLLKYFITHSGGQVMAREVLERCAEMVVERKDSIGPNGELLTGDYSLNNLHPEEYEELNLILIRCLRQSIVSCASGVASMSMSTFSIRNQAVGKLEVGLCNAVNMVQQGRGCLYTTWSMDMTLSMLHSMLSLMEAEDGKVQNVMMDLMERKAVTAACGDSRPAKVTFVWETFIRLLSYDSSEVRLLAIKILACFLRLRGFRYVVADDTMILFVGRYAEETSTLVLQSLGRLLLDICIREKRYAIRCHRAPNLLHPTQRFKWPVSANTESAYAYLSAALVYLETAAENAVAVEEKVIDHAVDRLSSMTSQLILAHPGIQPEVFKYVTSRLDATLDVGIWLRFVMVMFAQAIASYAASASDASVSGATLRTAEHGLVLDKCIWAALGHLGRKGLDAHTSAQLYRLAYLASSRVGMCALLLAHKLPWLVAGCCASDESLRAVCVATLEKLYRHNGSISETSKHTQSDSHWPRQENVYKTVFVAPTINATVVQEIARQIRSGDAVSGSHLRMAWKQISDMKFTKHAT